MKKYSIILVSISVLITAFASCKKSYLDEKPYSSYTPLTLTDSLGFEAAAVGLYNYESTILTYSSAQGWPSVWQVGTDVANATANQQGIEVPYYNYAQLTSTDGAASYIWGKYYALINNANAIIDNAENPSTTKIGAVGKKQVEAEAKFFRAYAYNNLATLFGKVPLITTPLTTPKTNFVRASLDDVNGLIISDLTYASANLSDLNGPGNVKLNVQGKPIGRANKYMAMQLLAEVYLRTGKNDLAEQQAKAVISSGKFSLIKARYGVRAGGAGDYYSDMFVYGNERRAQGNSEAIWVLEQENPSSVVGGNTDNAQQRRVWGAAYYNIAGLLPCDTLGGRSIGRLRLSNWVLYGLYPNGDMRNSQYSIKRRYYYNDPTNANYGKIVPFTGPDTLYKICPSTTKWGAFDPNDTFGYAMIKDFIMMRLGETYLLLAEAQVKQGKTADAAASINVLRTRANAPQVTADQMTLNFVLDERARELIGEENRRQTLMRTGTLVERSLRLNSGDAQHPTTGLADKNLLLPIPLSEIQLNKDAVLEQNPGY